MCKDIQDTAIFFLNNIKQLERVSLLNNMKIGFMKLPADIKNVDVNIFMVMGSCPLNPVSKQ